MNQSLFNLVEYTCRNIFLTGKAGTGKTTFLNEFVKKTEKKYIVVAPTGIAAINAGGVTIHSTFGLPLRTFIPTLDRIDQNLANNIQDLMPHFKYRKDKLKLLREVEIIIIDEVSMLRADVLDMMDFSLRHVRRNQKMFGGVQMLFIGDLYQLPPVVRDEYILGKYYKSAFFFDSYALKDSHLVTIELTKIYRQKDEKFLNILNNIRDGKRYDIDFDLLNERYDPLFEPTDESYVYLTSHNKMADEINRQKLEALSSSSYFYQAKVIGNFKETQYPNDERLELRVGCQVMFIRNDASGDQRYFNGKLATVIRLDQEEIWVRIEGDDDDYKLKTEVWEQKGYSLDDHKNIKEEVLGSFEQFPVRLAWAVTIHKSQGLTFDRLIIDAGKSFASGQVYVALSRCRTLEGIVLKSKITPDVIFCDHRVDNFQTETNANEKIDDIINSEKYDFAIDRMMRRVDCLWLPTAIQHWSTQALQAKVIDKAKATAVISVIKLDAKKLFDVFRKFDHFVKTKAVNAIGNDVLWAEIEAKSEGAVGFFFSNVNEKIFQPMKEFYSETKGVKGLKQFNEDFRVLLDDVKDYLDDLKSARLLEKSLFKLVVNADTTLAIKKVPSHVITYQLFEAGKTIPEIAKERGVAVETIWGHLDKFAAQGMIDLGLILAKEKIKEFEICFKNQQELGTLTEWKSALPDTFQYHEIRLLLSHYRFLSENIED